MILISHRGNVNGRNIESENYPDYIDAAINLGFDVEIDIWFVDERFFLGHDKPEYPIDLSWIINRKNNLWVHCKNIEAIIFLNVYDYGLHYFWHQNDTVTLTSKNFVWAYPGNQPIRGSIAVMPEIYDDNISTCLGICSDFILKYQ